MNIYIDIQIILQKEIRYDDNLKLVYFNRLRFEEN